MSGVDDLGIVFRDGIAPEDSPQGWDFALGPYTNFGAREWHEYGLHIQKDVAIPTRHGTLYADIFLPDGLPADAQVPVIMGISPYGKHARPQFPFGGLSPNLLSHFSIGEFADPGYWCKHGYAVVTVDAPGAFHSEGVNMPWGSQEAEAGADAVDWLGTQSWSNGAVTLTGASYYAMIGYRIAAQQPEHLKALMPWEGGIRMYDGWIHQGGIPSNPDYSFFPNWNAKWCAIGMGKMENLGLTAQAHPLFDGYWEDKTPDLGDITIPVFTSVGWASCGTDGGHLAGTVDAFRMVSSEHKWLLAWPYGHQNKWYLPELLDLQLQFLDHFLKGEGDLPDWPKVQVSARITETEETGLRAETDFPIPDTSYTKLHLDLAGGTLEDVAPADASVLSYDATERGTWVQLDHVFTEETELTGWMTLHLTVEIEEGDEADLFVQVQKLGADGEAMPVGPVPLVPPGATAFDLPVARGWLRSSLRELDLARATHFQPVHSFTNPQPLTPGTPVEVDVEIWPTSTLFRAGEGLRLLISGKDIYAPRPVRMVAPGIIVPFDAPTGHDDGNRGRHTLHVGGDHAAYLQVPVIPPR